MRSRVCLPLSLTMGLVLGTAGGCSTSSDGLGQLGQDNDAGEPGGGASGGSGAVGAPASREGGSGAADGGGTNTGGSSGGMGGSSESTDGPSADTGAAAPTDGSVGSSAGDASAAPDGPPAATVPPKTGGGSWSSAESLPGGPRQEVGVAVVNKVLFVVGGQSSGARRVEAYDPSTRKWELHEPLPFGVDHPNVASVKDKLYLLGGTQSNRVFEYNPFVPRGQRRWIEKRTMPTHRAAAATASIGSKIYVAGGQRSGRGVNDFAAYDTLTDTWDTRLPLLPGPGRNHVPGAAIDGVFYVIGGRVTGPTGDLQRRVDAFDTVSGSWSRKADMPTARGGSAAGVVNGLIIVVGGEGNSAQSSGVFPQTEAYDPKNDTWTVLAPMKTPRHGMGAGGIDGKLYVPAGAVRQGGGSAVAILEVFTP
jgi:hypothetical protein